MGKNLRVIIERTAHMILVPPGPLWDQLCPHANLESMGRLVRPRQTWLDIILPAVGHGPAVCFELAAGLLQLGCKIADFLCSRVIDRS